MTVVHDNTCLNLHDHIKDITKGSASKKLTLNIPKCKLLWMDRTHRPTNLRIHNVPIITSEEVNYSRVPINKIMTFKRITYQLIARARAELPMACYLARLGKLYKLFHIYRVYRELELERPSSLPSLLAKKFVSQNADDHSRLPLSPNSVSPSRWSP